MSVDYDLVVIGGSEAGIAAAMMAVTLKARVALVEQEQTVMAADAIAAPVLANVGHTMYHLQYAKEFGLWAPDTVLPEATAVWTQATRWADTATTAIAIDRSPAVLAAMGVEVIVGSGEFHRQPKPGFRVNGRSLRSRAYLLALAQLPTVAQTAIASPPPPPPVVMDGDGLAATGYCMATAALRQMPHLVDRAKLVILGAEASGVELAYTLIRLGQSVTLIVADNHILPDADPESARLLQAQLEALGVTVLTRTQVTQVRAIDGKKWVQVGNRAIEADEIFLATALPPDLTALNLAAVSVKWSPQGVWVNQRQQTTNPRIYACGSHLSSTSMAIASARVAVRNALFWPIARVDDRTIPTVIACDPELASVGLTESAAKQQFGQVIVVLRQPLKSLTNAQIRGEITGVCKLIVHRNGTLLGAHLVAPNAGEAIGTIALAVQQRLPVQTLVQLALPNTSTAAILSQTAAQWQQYRFAQHPKWQDFLETFFRWRRSWG